MSHKIRLLHISCSPSVSEVVKFADLAVAGAIVTEFYNELLQESINYSELSHSKVHRT